MTVRYGTMRENVLGLTIVNGRGEVVRTHSRARKSSAGYDLTRLLVGSEGTLGLICEATLRLRPIPPAAAAAACTFPSVEAAVACAVRVGQCAIPVARIELADELQIEAINRHDQTAFRVAPTLFLEFHGVSEEDVAGQARETGAIAVECGGSDFAWAYGKARFLAAEHGAAAVEMMREIKRALDPEGVFNPGKVAA